MGDKITQQNIGPPITKGGYRCKKIAISKLSLHDVSGSNPFSEPKTVLALRFGEKLIISLENCVQSEPFCLIVAPETFFIRRELYVKEILFLYLEFVENLNEFINISDLHVFQIDLLKWNFGGEDCIWVFVHV